MLKVGFGSCPPPNCRELGHRPAVAEAVAKMADRLPKMAKAARPECLAIFATFEPSSTIGLTASDSVTVTEFLQGLKEQGQSMGSIRKKNYTKPLPDDAELFEKSGKQFARVKPPKGRAVTYPLTVSKDGSQRIVCESATFVAKYRDGSGIIQEVSTGCRDEGAARSVLAELERRAELVRSGVISAAEDRIADHSATPIGEHFEAYLLHLEGSGCSPLHLRNVKAYIARLRRECELARLGDITAESLTKWMLTSMKAGLGARTRNLHRSALVAFCGWCVESSRMVTNPLTRVALANEKADRRHVRRSLTEAEIVKFLDAAERRPLLEALTVRRGSRIGRAEAQVRPEVEAELRRVGRERRLIYSTLLTTGLRKSELRSITIGQVHLDEGSPYLELSAAHEKNRQGSLIPLRQDIADELRRWIDDSKQLAETTSDDGTKTLRDFASRPLFRVPEALDKVLSKDLKLAGIEKVDESGRVVDVHALRVTFATLLTRAGVAPRTAQAAMRHSDLRLTMQVYTDSRLLDTKGAVEALPSLPQSGFRPPSLRAPPSESLDSQLAPLLAPLLAPSGANLGQAESSAVTLAASSVCDDLPGRVVVTSSPVNEKGSLSVADSEPFEERVKGIEPSPKAWEAFVLPLNYTRLTRRDYGLAG